jgi:hypothetical protein
LAARALVKTAAVLDASGKPFLAKIEPGGPRGHPRSSPSGQLLDGEEAFLAENPETKAVNAVTLVEKLDKRLPELQVKARYYDLGALPPELDRAHLRRRASRPSPTTRTTT